MKIQYLSDLHLENERNSQWLASHMPAIEGDILVMAGDVTVIGNDQLLRHPFIDWCSSNFKQTFIVAGNHELYGGSDADGWTSRDGMAVQLRQNVAVLGNRWVTVGDVDLVFTTLWSPISPLKWGDAREQMVDYQRITFKGRKLDPRDSFIMHNRCLNWLLEALGETKSPHKVIVTHHCPIMSEDPRYAHNGLTSAFIVPIPDFVEACGADAWLYGHTHYNAARDTLLGRTKLLTNQLGYVDADTNPCEGFTPTLTFEL